MAACLGKRKSRRIVLLLAMAALGMGWLGPAAAVAQERVGDIVSSVLSVPAMDSRSGEGTNHGYVEQRVRLKNTGRKDHVVHLSYPKLHSGVDHGVVATRSVRVAAGQEVVVSVYQPPRSVSNEELEVRVEGVARGRTIHAPSLRGYHSYGWSSDPVKAAVLLSRAVPRDFPSEAEKEKQAAEAANLVAEVEEEVEVYAGPGMGAGMGTGMPVEVQSPDAHLALFRSELPVAQWSPNWLGYSCFDAILCSTKEVEEMPPPVQLAVRRFIECGGMLLVHGQEVPAVFSENGVSDGEGGYFVGMGHVLPMLHAGSDDWDATYRKLVDLRIDIYQPDERPANLLDLLVAETTVPVRGLFLLILVFGVVIGPANLWLLSRYRRRIWLWWNVPVISFVTCLLVFGYSLASEGWAGRGKTASLTLLDESTRRATTLGYVSYYNPLAPGGMRFDVETDVARQRTGTHHWRHYGSGWEEDGDLCFVDWTNDQYMASGWMKARIPAYFQFRKNADRRERLTVEPQPDGTLKVVNALGADIERLHLADASGHLFEGRDIPAGAERTLSPTDQSLTDEVKPDRMRVLFTNANWLSRFHELELRRNPATVLGPGCYIAFLDRSPFVESPLEDVVSEHSVAIVYGIMKGQEDGR